MAAYESSAGGYHTCGISKLDETDTNLLKCWGLVDDGQTGYVSDKNTLLGAAPPSSRRPSARGGIALAGIGTALVVLSTPSR